MKFWQQLKLLSSAQGRQAVLDFPCAHTEQTDHGFALTLTIFGKAESKLAVGVSKMPMTQMATIWKVTHYPCRSCNVHMHTLRLHL